MYVYASDPGKDDLDILNKYNKESNEKLRVEPKGDSDLEAEDPSEESELRKRNPLRSYTLRKKELQEN